jgi:excisionase family DNA binding protein
MAESEKRPSIKEAPRIRIGDYEFYCGMDLMEVLGCSERTIRRYLQSGRLKGMKFAGKWYISADSFHQFIEAQMSPQPKSKKKSDR